MSNPGARKGILKFLSSLKIKRIKKYKNKQRGMIQILPKKILYIMREWKTVQIEYPFSPREQKI